MAPEDVSYYRKRAEAERRLARASENGAVAAVHEELARQYEALIELAHFRPRLRLLIASEAPAPVRDLA